MAINYEQIKAVNAELKTTDVKGKDYAEVPQSVGIRIRKNITFTAVLIERIVPPTE